MMCPVVSEEIEGNREARRKKKNEIVPNLQKQ
jgi:hypothetical protein